VKHCRWMCSVLLALCLLMNLTACGQKGEEASGKQLSDSGQSSSAPVSEPGAPEEPEEPAERRVSLIAVGDNLIHNTLFEWARTGDGFDFSSCYDAVRDIVSAADIAVVNQESPLGGPDYRPSGYPNFNSPQQVGLDLVDAGFDVISQANNHAMDRGAGAVEDTVDFWRGLADRGVYMTGMYRDFEDRQKLLIVERNGVKVGFLSYTYGTNGIPLPEDNPDIVSLIDLDRISYDIERLSPKCDLVAVIMHWGVEYSHTPSEEQESLAKKLAEMGAGLIIGHHPHVVQPAEWVEADNGNRAFCIYSLGNFISSQNKPATMLESMLSVEIVKDEAGTRVEKAEVMAMVNHYRDGFSDYRVYPLADYTDELAKSHYVRTKGDVSVARMTALAQEIYGDWLVERVTPVTYDAQAGGGDGDGASAPAA